MKQQAPRTAQSTEIDPIAWIKTLLSGICVRFTVLCILILLISLLTSDSLENTVVDTARFFLLLPLSLCLTLATLVRRSRLGKVAKVLLHPTLSLGGLYLCAYLPYQISVKPTGEQTLAVSLLALLIYAVTATVYLIANRKKHQKAIDDTPYESVFSSQAKH